MRLDTPVRVGVAFLPSMLSTVPSAAITGALIARTGKFQVLIWLGWILITLGNGLTILYDMSTKTYVWVLVFIFAGIGQGKQTSIEQTQCSL